MGVLFEHGVPVEDPWIPVDGEQSAHHLSHVLMTLEYFNRNRSELASTSQQLAISLEAGEDVTALADDLRHFSMITLDFPSFADGRSFSKARLLRDELKFQGQIRAVGDIRIDQIPHLERSGFDSWLVSHQPTIDKLREGGSTGLKLYYQPALGSQAAVQGPAWRRSAAG